MYKHSNDYGFIIIRHIQNDRHNYLWQANYSNIRKYYPSSTKIMIVDDNSSTNTHYKFTDNTTNTTNTTTKTLKEIDELYTSIDENLSIYYVADYAPELLGAGEILGYYMFKLVKPEFKYAVVIHDSAIINTNISFSKALTLCKCGVECVPIWMFESELLDDKNSIEILLNKLDNSTVLWKIYMDFSKWVGCYGVMSIVSIDYIDEVDKLFGVLNQDFIKNMVTQGDRKMRCAMERIWGIIMCYMHRQNLGKILHSNYVNNPDYNYHRSCFANICSYYKLNGYNAWYDNYDDYKKGVFNKLPIIKVWNGR